MRASARSRTPSRRASICASSWYWRRSSWSATFKVSATGGIAHPSLRFGFPHPRRGAPVALVVKRAFSADLHRYRFYTTSWDSNRRPGGGTCHECSPDGRRGCWASRSSRPHPRPGGVRLTHGNRGRCSAPSACTARGGGLAVPRSPSRVPSLPPRPERDPGELRGTSVPDPPAHLGAGASSRAPAKLEVVFKVLPKQGEGRRNGTRGFREVPAEASPREARPQAGEHVDVTPRPSPLPESFQHRAHPLRPLHARATLATRPGGEKPDDPVELLHHAGPLRDHAHAGAAEGRPRLAQGLVANGRLQGRSRQVRAPHTAGGNGLDAHPARNAAPPLFDEVPERSPERNLVHPGAGDPPRERDQDRGAPAEGLRPHPEDRLDGG